MAGAGFRLQEIDGHVEPGIWLASASIEGDHVEIPIDLIVPDGVAPPGGRRGARLPDHGKRAARRVPGLEATLVDRSPIEVAALDPDDARVHTVQVAGVAALLIAKAHKLGERTEKGRADRLKDKDALDVLRLMRASDPYEVAVTLASLSSDGRAAGATALGMRRLDELFGRRGRPGIEMAVRALRTALPEERVTAICVAYTRALLDGV